MAGIDKTYVNKEQLKIAVDWAKKVGTVTLENGHKFKPIDWIKGYNDLDDAKFWEYDYEWYVLWNTPCWFDRWLWCNCELPFVRERLMEVYSERALAEYKDWKYVPTKKEKRKYVFTKVPVFKKGWKCFAKHKYAMWRFDIMLPNARWEADYDEQTNSWHAPFGMLPADDDYHWHDYHKNLPNKKTILRLLRKWNLPKGTKVILNSYRYYGFDFEIVVK